MTNTVLAQRQSKTMNADLVLATIRDAQRRWGLPKSCIFHSDYAEEKTMPKFSKTHCDYWV
jgi:hypothetical protein